MPEKYSVRMRRRKYQFFFRKGGEGKMVAWNKKSENLTKRPECLFLFGRTVPYHNVAFSNKS